MNGCSNFNVKKQHIYTLIQEVLEKTATVLKIRHY